MFIRMIVDDDELCYFVIDGIADVLYSLQMLSAGVDRVVDQVINPKVIGDFKPQIDRVICEYLGVDYDKWIERQSEYFEVKCFFNEITYVGTLFFFSALKQ